MIAELATSGVGTWAGWLGSTATIYEYLPDGNQAATTVTVPTNPTNVTVIAG